MHAEKTQSWQLHGLRPMHRALVRRIAETMAIQSDLRLLWSVHPMLPSRTDWFVPKEPCICMIDVDLWTATQNASGWELDRATSSLDLWSSSSIRLLWSWARSNACDLAWASSVGFAGVISDALSLHAWARTSLTRGAHLMRTNNPLLRDLPRAT